ncbi:MAG: phosphate acyltransferase PlsX [Alphaproteobacteria bacterium]|nr:phosphate acyltransferase PlsX [Alphaproteobacteria bacterium]
MANTVIAVDVMGGDFGPSVTIAGVARAQGERPHTSFLLYGDAAAINAELKKHKSLAAVSTIIHCDVNVPMDAKPSVALRAGRKTSGMWKAIHAVKEGEAQASVSAGNTGALMAMSKIILRMQPGIERPAIACIWPTMRGESIVLDVGANIGGTAAQYLQFAAMGAAYARTLFGLKKPEIGLLNIGTEEMKGTDEVKRAAEFLERSELNFKGFVEGDGIGRGDVDVVVTDGFTGNIALKTAEGTARQMAEYLRQAMSSSLMTKIGYLFARSGFAALRARMDPNAANGGMFLGLNGVVVKSHGGADIDGFATAVDVAIEAVDADMLGETSRRIEKIQVLLDDVWAESLD